MLLLYNLVLAYSMHTRLSGYAMLWYFFAAIFLLCDQPNVEETFKKSSRRFVQDKLEQWNVCELKEVFEG